MIGSNLVDRIKATGSAGGRSNVIAASKQSTGGAGGFKV